MSGVAFEATIGAYRVFGCEGTVSDDILVEAIIRAFTDGNDVITMSLGGTVGWTEAVSSVVSSRVAKAGRIVTIAAGNEGEAGAFFASAPASGIEVIAVGSVDNTVIPVQNAKSSDRDAPIPYFSLQPLNFTESLPVFAISKTIVPNDACNPLPDSTPDLSGFMVLIRRGGCPLVSKLENVAKKGARVALIYNNGGSPNTLSGGVIPAAMISSEDGAYLLEKFNAGQPPNISFPQQGGAGSVPAPTGGLVSTFSTYGPTFDAFLKPALAAPGGGIVSTFPLPLGAFAILSGTSMATPYMAGVGALLLAVKGRNVDVARAARDILQSTANIIPSSKDETALFQTASQQGAGLVDAFKALTSTTIVAPGQLLLNDTAFFNGKQTFTVTNSGSKAVTYKLSHTPAGTAHTLINDSIQPALYPVPLTADFAHLSLSSDTFYLKPGEKKKVTVSFTAPTLTNRTIPVYSGWIEVAGQETGECLSVTYLGIAARLKESKVIDNTDFTFGQPIPALIDGNGNITTQEASFNFKNGNFPSILYRLAFGTPTLLFDLVAADFDQSALVQRDLRTRSWLGDFIGNIDSDGETELKSWWADHFSTWDGVKPAGTFGLVPIIGPLAQFDYNPRHSQSATPGVGFSVLSLSDPVFANNQTIPNGRYRILMRALKVTGDPTDQNDYESFLSPVIGINA
jgi:subtilisin family serine protease